MSVSADSYSLPFTTGSPTARREATKTVVARRTGGAERRPSAARFRTPAPPPRWARRAAVFAVLVTVPSALWRTAMAVGIPVGASEQILREHYAFPSWGTLYVFGLTAVQLGLAMLTLVLVQRWGEAVPPWIPFVGGTCRYLPGVPCWQPSPFPTTTAIKPRSAAHLRHNRATRLS